MKNKKLISLSEFKKNADLEIIREGFFTSPGLKGVPGKKFLISAFGKFDIRSLTKASGVSCIIADQKLAPLVPNDFGLAISKKPMESLLAIHLKLYESNFYQNNKKTFIDKSASISSSCWIDEKDVSIGAKTKIGPNSVILSGTKIGDNVTIGPNVTIGSEGFEVREFKNKILNVPHVGGVEIKNNCNIQANSSIAKAIFDDQTLIKENSTIAHSCFVSHGVKIGKFTKIAPGAVICGACEIGNNVWIGPNATIKNALSIGDNSFVSIGAVVISSVKKGQKIYAHFSKTRFK